jgi:hypothetical protein
MSDQMNPQSEPKPEGEQPAAPAVKVLLLHRYPPPNEAVTITVCRPTELGPKPRTRGQMTSARKK